MKRAFIPFILLLSACNGNLPSVPGNTPNTPSSSQPAPIASAQPSSSVFGNALNKRTLSLQLFGQGATQNNRNASGDNASGGNTQAPLTSPGAPPMAEASGTGAARPGMAPMPSAGMVADAKIAGPWYGGGEFNQYVLQYAEENGFAASKAQTLLNAYNDTVKPLLTQWDGSARLIESQAFVGQSKNDAGWFYLPGSGDEPEQIKVNYLFRFASSSRKETLVFYLTDEDTRVHRLVWGEANVDLSLVKHDSEEAVEIARKGFSDRSRNPGYPVYPEQSYPEMEVLYQVPAAARWSVSLNQNNGSSRYFVSVNFEQKSGKEQQMVYGSAEVDAVSGKILSLNRPTLYKALYDKAVAVSEPAVNPVMMAAPPSTGSDPDQPVSN